MKSASPKTGIAYAFPLFPHRSGKAEEKRSSGYRQWLHGCTLDWGDTALLLFLALATSS